LKTALRRCNGAGHLIAAGGSAELYIKRLPADGDSRREPEAVSVNRAAADLASAERALQRTREASALLLQLQRPRKLFVSGVNADRPRTA
jgi:hypothetical protein